MPDNEALNQLYNEMEKQLAPYMVSTARRYRLLDSDDAVQEARIAILNAMSKFDYNKATRGYVPYMKEVVVNTYKQLIYCANKQSRCPRVGVQTIDGSWEKKSVRPSSYEAIVEESGGLLVEQELADSELDMKKKEILVEKFKSKIEEKLDDREIQVFRCKVNPPEELLEIASKDSCDDPKNTHIAKFMSIDKYQVDWAIYKIRIVVTLLAKSSEYDELFGVIVQNGWPRIHIIEGNAEKGDWGDKDIFAERRLSRTIIKRTFDACSVGRRLVFYYDWGVVLDFKLSGERAMTLFLEGTFNPRSGELFGSSGARMVIPVPGYARFAKELSATHSG